MPLPEELLNDVIGTVLVYERTQQVPGDHFINWEAKEHAQSTLLGALNGLQASLLHMQSCRTCAQGSWRDCPGGLGALAALRALEPQGDPCPV